MLTLLPVVGQREKYVPRMVTLVSQLRANSCVVAEVRPSPNHGERKGGVAPDMIVLHYTGMSDNEAALKLLSSPGSDVSAHYVVLQDGHIIQMVAEDRRAWHAGTSSWAGETDINSCSIGIEIANPGHDHNYPEFPRRQVAAVTALCRSIFTRYKIRADRVLAHSDIAPARKQDPGEKFPWRLLADFGDWIVGQACAAKHSRADLRARRKEPDHRRGAKAAGKIRLWRERERLLRRHHA